MEGSLQRFESRYVVNEFSYFVITACDSPRIQVFHHLHSYINAANVNFRSRKQAKDQTSLNSGTSPRSEDFASTSFSLSRASFVEQANAKAHLKY